MARLKTDWILFLTILAMVGLRPGDAVQRLERRGGAAVSRGAVSLRRAPIAVGHRIVPGADVLQAARLPQAEHARRGRFQASGSCWELLVVVYFADPRSHRWFQLEGSDPCSRPNSPSPR